MILDRVENLLAYLSMNKGFTAAAEFLAAEDINELADGKYKIDGENVFATVVRDSGRRSEDALLEIHRKYIDIQLVLEGCDEMGWKALSSCAQPADEFDKEKDLQFFRDEAELHVPVTAGMFAIFFPEDAHMPMISEGKLHKIIIKIAVDQ